MRISGGSFSCCFGSILQMVKKLNPKQIAKLITEDPDILLEHSPCPECGKPAYVGLREVECPTPGCRFHYKKQEEIIQAETGEHVDISKYISPVEWNPDYTQGRIYRENLFQLGGALTWPFEDWSEARRVIAKAFDSGHTNIVVDPLPEPQTYELRMHKGPPVITSKEELSYKPNNVKDALEFIYKEWWQPSESREKGGYVPWSYSSSP